MISEPNPSKHRKSIRLLACCGVLMLVLMCLMHWFALPKITSVEGYNDLGQVSKRLLPDLNSQRHHWNYKYIVHIDYRPGEQTNYSVYFHSCRTVITLNGQPIPLGERLDCGAFAGMRIDLAPALVPGDNELVIVTRVAGLQIGALVFDGNPSHLCNWLGLAMLAVACVALVVLMNMQTGLWGDGVLLAAGLVMYMYQFVHTSLMQNTMDMPGHLDYVGFIVNYHAIPNPYSSHESYQPPLFYFLGAQVVRIADWAGSFDSVSALRMMCTCSLVAYNYIAALTLRRFVAQKLAYYTALGWLVFYPSAILFSSRIDSNLLFYPLFAACMYYALRWFQEQKSRFAALTLVFLGLGIATRSNMLVMFPILGIMGLWQWRKHKWQRFPVRPSVYIALAVVLLGLGANFGRTYYYHKHGFHESYIVGNADHLSEGLRVVNKPYLFLTFDLESYINYPYWSSFDNRKGRQYFWNSVLKTSLFGESWLGVLMVAKALCVWLLAIIIWTMGSLASCVKDKPKHEIMALFGLILGGSLAALMANRIVYPYSCSQDFRYVYPAMTAITGFLGLGMSALLEQRKYVQAAIGMVLVIMFSAMAIALYIVPHLLRSV